MDHTAVTVVPLDFLCAEQNQLRRFYNHTFFLSFFATLYARPEDTQPRLLSALGTSFKNVASLVATEKAFGVVPSDEEDISAPSVLANLYLPPLHLLLAVRWVGAAGLVIRVLSVTWQKTAESRSGLRLMLRVFR